MRIVLRKDAFVALSDFSEKDVLKNAKFWFHGRTCTWRGKGPCPGCSNGVGTNVWYTTSEAVAVKLVDYGDDAVKARLQKRTDSVVASKATDFTATEIPRPPGLEYLAYQRAGVAYSAQRKNTLFGDDMGLGKTIQAIGRVNVDENPKSILILCPASLRINWTREWKKWTTHNGLRAPFIVDSIVPDNAPVVVCNYDRFFSRPQWKHVFKRIAEYISVGITVDDGSNDYTDGKGMLKPSVYDQLMSRHWDYLIADEAHYLKNPKSIRAKAVLGAKGKKGEASKKGIIDVADHFLALTGTPILNGKPIELWPLLAALDPAEFGDFFKYALRYCAAKKVQVGRNKFVWDFSGSSNLDELQERLRATVMVRRLKKDVLTDLPPKRRQIIPLTTNGASEVVKRELAKWDTFEDKRQALMAKMQLAEAADDDAAYAKAASELTETNRVAFQEIAKERHAVAVKKIPAVIEHLEGLFEEGLEKVIVFAHHKDVVNAIAKRFGAEAVSLTGETPMGARQEAVDRFQTDPTCKLFIGNIQAAGVGLTLTASSMVVFAELSWVPAEVTQAEDRAHRYGQQGSVLIHHLVFDGSLDARMVMFIMEKQIIADRALDNNAPKPDLPVLPPTADGHPAPKPAVAKKWPEATPGERDAAKFAMQLLAGMCDGALELDGAGFNKMDTHIGHDLANKAELFTDGQVYLAKRLATKYKRQLPVDVLASLSITPKQ